MKMNYFIFFSVADNGIGISERDFERVFKVFQKVHNEDSQSHGIGLAVCKKNCGDPFRSD